jgi:septum site-determining protein MinC
MAAFNLKAGLTPITTLLIQSNDLAQIQKELKEKVQQAPNMFIRLPCIFDFFELTQPIDLPSLQMLCHEFGMLPIGVKNAHADHHELLEHLELADFGKGSGKGNKGASKGARTSTQKSTNIASVSSEAVSAEEIPEALEKFITISGKESVAEQDTESNKASETATIPTIMPKTTVHKFPVRSGQQLRAEGDLIIFGIVSTGAEVLAGGSIHIFGPLRGRALAGINGNSEATISCQALEAELVAIAGEYRLFEDSEQHCKQATLIQLDNGRLNIESL